MKEEKNVLNQVIMRLSDLGTGERGYITKIRGRGSFQRRISEMGFVKGKQIEVIKNAPLKDPIEYRILNYLVTLRRAEADLIEISCSTDLPPNNMATVSLL